MLSPLISIGQRTDPEFSVGGCGNWPTHLHFYELSCIPPNLYVEVPNPVPQNVTISGDRVFKGDSIKMRSYGRSLSTWLMSLQEEEIWTHPETPGIPTQTERPCGDRVREGGQGEESLEKPTPQCFAKTSSFHNCEKINLSRLSCPGCGVCYAAWAD